MCPSGHNGSGVKVPNRPVGRFRYTFGKGRPSIVRRSIPARMPFRKKGWRGARPHRQGTRLRLRGSLPWPDKGRGTNSCRPCKVPIAGRWHPRRAALATAVPGGRHRKPRWTTWPPSRNPIRRKQTGRPPSAIPPGGTGRSSGWRPCRIVSGHAASFSSVWGDWG